jgi:hypothetical protein
LGARSRFIGVGSSAISGGDWKIGKLYFLQPAACTARYNKIKTLSPTSTNNPKPNGMIFNHSFMRI